MNDKRPDRSLRCRERSGAATGLVSGPGCRGFKWPVKSPSSGNGPDRNKMEFGCQKSEIERLILSCVIQSSKLSTGKSPLSRVTSRLAITGRLRLDCAFESFKVPPWPQYLSDQGGSVDCSYVSVGAIKAKRSSMYYLYPLPITYPGIILRVVTRSLFSLFIRLSYELT
jgi:hypothetical protein